MKIMKNKSLPDAHGKGENTAAKDYSLIGYYGRPITDLSRDELLEAFAELAELYKESQRKKQ